jgi:hypothetical protein
MTFLKLSNFGWLGLLGAMAGSASNACSNNAAPPPMAYVYGSIGPGQMTGVDDEPACGFGSDETWQLGSMTSPKPVDYADGSSAGGSMVNVFCQVDQSGDGYSIDLSATIQGAISGSLTVNGQVSATGSSSNLSANFTTAGLHFSENNGCTFTLTYNGGPVPMNGLPAQGRIWGHIDCPVARDNGQEGLGADGGDITRTCDASADFLFENCQ